MMERELVGSPVASEQAPATRSSSVGAEGRPCVLFATNGSAEAAAAQRFAAALAERDDLPLRVLMVLEPLPTLPAQPSLPTYEMTTETRNARQILARVRGDVDRTMSRESLTTSMIIGSPGHTIAEAARAWNASYVVLGAGRRNRLEHLVAGDTVVRVLRSATAPVIAVPASCGLLPRNAVAAVDFGPASIEAARAASRLVQNGVLHLVHVRPAPDLPATDPAAWSEVYETGAATLMKQLATELSERDVDVRIEWTLLHGRPADVILEYANRTAADLIAVGQHGHGAVERFLFGTVAHALVRNAHCPVLVAPVARLAE